VTSAEISLLMPILIARNSTLPSVFSTAPDVRTFAGIADGRPVSAERLRPCQHDEDLRRHLNIQLRSGFEYEQHVGRTHIVDEFRGRRICRILPSSAGPAKDSEIDVLASLSDNVRFRDLRQTS